MKSMIFSFIKKTIKTAIFDLSFNKKIKVCIRRLLKNKIPSKPEYQRKLIKRFMVSPPKN